MVARDFSFTRSPVWLAGHVVALTAIVVFTSLGFWQLRRHAERVDLDRRIEQRTALAPVALGGLLSAHHADLASIELRRVTVRGVYDPATEVILNGQSLSGISGHNVLTPLRLADGSIVIVNRGWIPIDASGPPVTEAAPARGEVLVDGIVRLPQTRGSFGPADPAEGTLDRVSRVDLDRLQGQFDAPLAPVWVQAVSETPPHPGELPLALPVPEGGAGPPHLSYAVQWFVFAGVVAVGYPVLLSRTARRSGRAGSAAT